MRRAVSHPLLLALLIVAVAGVAALLTEAVRQTTGETLFTFFVAAVALVAWAGGTAAGLAAMMLVTGVIAFAFLDPVPGFHVLGSAQQIRLLSFVGVATLISFLSGRLRRARDEAERSAAEAARERLAAEQAGAAKGEFLATMSHELRTPINALLGYADLLEVGVAGAVTTAQVAYIGRIRTAARHLLTLVNDTLDLAKLDAGRLTVHAGRVGVRQAVESALALVMPQATAKGVELSVAAVTDDVACVGDADRVRQILINLLSNAITFTPSGGRVRVTWGEDSEPDMDEPRDTAGGASCSLRVSDTGVGIAPADQERIFEAFEQVESGRKRSAGGTGLGLAISRRLARRMGGDLTVESRPGSGATFTLRLPRTS